MYFWGNQNFPRWFFKMIFLARGIVSLYHYSKIHKPEIAKMPGKEDWWKCPYMENISNKKKERLSDDLCISLQYGRMGRKMPVADLN